MADLGGRTATQALHGPGIQTSDAPAKDIAALFVGLMFFWQLLRQACISTVLPLPQVALAQSETPLWPLIAFQCIALACCAPVALIVRNPGAARLLKPLALVLGIGASLAGTLCTKLLDPTEDVLPFAQLAVAFFYAASVALTAALATNKCIALAHCNAHAMLSCVFGSSLGSILLTFILYDMFSAMAFTALAAPAISAISLCLAGPCTTDAPTSNEPCRQEGFSSNGSLPLLPLACILGATVLLKAFFDTSVGASGELERMVKHFVGALELGGMFALAYTSSSARRFARQALYFILCGLVAGIALIAISDSVPLIQTGVATVTSARVCSESVFLAVLAIATVSRRLSRATASWLFVGCIAPASLVGYGLIPLAARTTSVSLSSLVDNVSIATLTIVTLVVITAYWRAERSSHPEAPAATQSNQQPGQPSDILDDLALARGLTQRETDIARLLIEGLSAKQISERECISVNTVQSQGRSLYRKLDIHSRADLLALVNRM